MSSPRFLGLTQQPNIGCLIVHPYTLHSLIKQKFILRFCSNPKIYLKHETWKFNLEITVYVPTT